MAKRSDTDRVDAHTMFDEIVDLGIDEGTGYVSKLTRDQLLQDFQKLLDDTFEAGAIAGRAEVLGKDNATERQDYDRVFRFA